MPRYCLHVNYHPAPPTPTLRIRPIYRQTFTSLDNALAKAKAFAELEAVKDVTVNEISRSGPDRAVVKCSKENGRIEVRLLR